MPLWTPYADAEAENLKKSTAMELEPASPVTPPRPTEHHTSHPVPYGYYIPATLEPTLQPMNYYATQMAYQYGNPPHMSPSTSSDQNASIYLDTSNDPEYIIYEQNALRAMAERNGGTLVCNNPRMRRPVRSTKADGGRHRQRNNIAAKESRDRRRLRELKLGLKVEFLEKQRRKLQAMVASGMCSKCFPHELYE